MVVTICFLVAALVAVIVPLTGVNFLIKWSRNVQLPQANPQEFLTSSKWQALKVNGAVPVVMSGQAGRSNPFAAAFDLKATPGGRDLIRIGNMLAVTTELRHFHEDTGHYPAGRSLPLGTDDTKCLTDKGWQAARACEQLEKSYLNPVPADPGEGRYEYSSDGTSYQITMQLETSSDRLSSWEYTGTPHSLVNP